MLYVKTYDICSGEVSIGNVLHQRKSEVPICSWTGTRGLVYEGEEDVQNIEPNTLIWDETNKRHVFAYGDDIDEGVACFSTVVVDMSPYLENLLIDDERVKYKMRT